MDVKPVIVGVDGSPDSVRALRWAAEHARLYEAPLQVLTAFEVPVVYGPSAMAGWQDSKTVEKDSHAALTGAVCEALGEGAQVKERVERGHPAERLVKASKDAQLIVVGSRGRGGFAGMLLGSVSQHVVTHSRCPVIVMPHEAPEKQ